MKKILFYFILFMILLPLNAVDTSKDPGSYYYNLGNSFYLNEEYAEAVAAYNRALYYYPLAGDIRHNKNMSLSKLASSSVKESNQSVSVFPFFPSLYSFYSLSILILVLSVLVLARKLFWKQNLTLFFTLSILNIILIFSLYIHYKYNDSLYISNEEVSLYRGDSPLHEELLKAEKGEEFILISEKGDWCKVLIPGKSTVGWLEKQYLLNYKQIDKGDKTN